MKPKPILILLVVLFLAALACNLPSTTRTETQSPGEEQPNEETIPATETVTSSASAPDLASAALTVEDLPKGFQQLSDEDLANLGFQKGAVSNSFRGMLSKAETQSFTAFIKSSSSGYEIILSTVLAPLSTMERMAIDMYLSNPDQFAKDFAQKSQGSDAQPFPYMDTIGDRSAGIRFITNSGGRNLQSETVISRRDEAIQAAIVLYPEGSQPEISATDVAKIVDQKISQALK